MQQIMRGGAPNHHPSPLSHIQHPPPIATIHQPQPRYSDPASSAAYEHQQRLIQQQQQQAAHRERQMAGHRGLGVQPNPHTMVQQMPVRQMSGGPVRPVRGPAVAAQGWPHPTLPGQRIPEQHMQQYQQQHQQAAYAQQQQQQQQQQMRQMQAPVGYRLAPGPGAQMGNGPTPPQHPQPQSIQQQHLQNRNLTSTPSRPPLSHSLSYLETNNVSSAVPIQPVSTSAPNSAHPNQSQVQRAPSRQAMRSASPMPPPSLPIPSQIGMQASTSASAIISNTQQTTLPLRSSTLPLTSAPLPPIRPATAGPSIPPPQPSPTSQIRQERGSDPPDNPQRLALREKLSKRLKRHMERTEKQLLAAEKLEKALKKKTVGRKSCKEMSKDGAWRGKFNDLIEEYLEKSGYESALSGLRSDRDKVKVVSSAMGERNPTGDSAMTELPEDAGTGKTTLVEFEADGQLGCMGKTSSRPDGIDAGAAHNRTAKGDAARKAGEASKARAEDEGDLGKLFMWYTVQRFSRQIMSTLQSSAVREFRIITDLSTTPTFDPKGKRPVHSGLDIDPSRPLGISSVPPTAQVPSSAIAAKIVISAPQAAVRAASVAADPSTQPAELSQKQIPSSAGPPPQAAQRSPNEMIGLTATLQQADVMRAAQEAQIQAQQAASKAAVETSRPPVGPGGPLNIQNPADRIAVQIGDQLVCMPREEYLHRQAEQNWMARQNHLQQHGMVQHVMPIQQGSQMMMVPVPIQQYPDGADRGYTPGPMMKRVLEGEVDEVKKKAKIGKQPTPEEHHRQAIEMATKAKAMGILYTGGTQGVPSIQGSRETTQLPQQYGARPPHWTRQLPQQHAFGSGATPSAGTYDDHATPQASDPLSGRAGMVPSPTVIKASHKKKPSVLGLEGASGMTDGEPTPTSAKKRGAKKGPKGSAKKKGKQETPTSADGPTTPFGIPQTPATNITHTPSHPPGEFQPSPTAGSSNNGYQNQLGHDTGQQASVPVPVQGQLQVQLGQHHQPQHYQQNLPMQQQQQQQQYQSNNPSTGTNSSNPFDGMHLSDDEILKALSGHLPRETALDGAPPQSAGPSATGFDGMGFDLNDPGALNFDWDSMDFGGGDTWGDYSRNE